MTFKTIHTTYGLERLAEAETTGLPINLPEMAVGDGNGNPVDPEVDQTELVRERYRAAVNRVYQDPSDNTRFTAELVIPASMGGFTLREVGVFDDQGGLFVVGNLPDTYKPEESEGAYADTVVRVEFRVSNADVVALQIDPNVAVATQAWISNNVTAGTLIPGGTTAQVLRKATNADGDFEWGDPTEAQVVINMVEEVQTLADQQAIIDLTKTTTRGLALYVDGVRLREDEWTADPEIETRLELAQSYPEGSKLIAVQNEPANSMPTPLERSKNLSDLDSATEARANLDVLSKTETRQMGPAGMVAHFARTTAPSGWLKANGAAVSRTAYSHLFAVIGTNFGAGDGFTTFNLPDLRGEFLRGWDDGRGIDGGRALGSSQSDENKSHSHDASSGSNGSHTHGGSTSSAGSHSHNATSSEAGDHKHTVPLRTKDYHAQPLPTQRVGEDGNASYGMLQDTSSNGAHSHTISVGTAGSHSHSLSINSAGAHSHSISVDTAGGAESRPRNIALLACIKY